MRCGVVVLVALVGCGEEAAPPPPQAQMAQAPEQPAPVVPMPVGSKPDRGVQAGIALGERPTAEAEDDGRTAAAGAPCSDQPAEGEREVTVTWSDVRSTPSCFYFSGPGTLGRNDRLGTSARIELRDGRAVLDFGGGIRFTGTAGERVALTRTSEHDHTGTWRVTERIAGRWRAGVERQGATACDQQRRVLRAVYRYEECEAANPASCPGQCTIRATLTIR